MLDFLSRGSILPGAIDFGFGLLQNDTNRTNADHAMDRSDANMRAQMAFQERMSNSAYQRATTDMTKAGINPMVAFTQGGASSPSGSSPQMTPAASSRMSAQGGGGGSMNMAYNAMDMVRLKNEMKAQGSQQALNDALST